MKGNKTVLFSQNSPSVIKIFLLYQRIAPQARIGIIIFCLKLSSPDNFIYLLHPIFPTLSWFLANLIGVGSSLYFATR